MATDASGDPLWTRTFGSTGQHQQAHVIAPMLDGFLVAGAGSNDTLLVARLSGAGSTDWEGLDFSGEYVASDGNGVQGVAVLDDGFALVSRPHRK